MAEQNIIGRSLLTSRKGKGRATDADLLDNTQIGNQRSRAEPELSVTRPDSAPGLEPLPKTSSPKRKRSMEDRLADLRRQKAAERAKSAAANNAAFVGPQGPQNDQRRREGASGLDTEMRSISELHW